MSTNLPLDVPTELYQKKPKNILNYEYRLKTIRLNLCHYSRYALVTDHAFFSILSSKISTTFKITIQPRTERTNKGMFRAKNDFKYLSKTLEPIPFVPDMHW